MEILVVTLAALTTLLLPLMVVLFETALLATSAAVELLTLAREARSRGSWSAAWAEQSQARVGAALFGRWARRAGLAAALLLVGTLLLVTVLNHSRFEWFVRQALRAAERQNGIAVSFDSASGDLFTGRLQLANARFFRSGHPVSDFELDVAKFDLDADVSQLLFGGFVFEEVTLAGVRGRLIQTGPGDAEAPRRQFTIERLQVDDVAVELADRSRPPREVAAPLVIRQLSIADFRSAWAAFDLLFRSSCEGLLAGQPFAIIHQPQAVAAEQQTTWVGRDLPIHLLSGYLTGPLSWLTDGRLDVEVISRWSAAEHDPRLDMHWRVVAHDFAAQPPTELAPLQKAVLEPALAALNGSTARLPLEFDLALQKDVFRGQLSPLAAGLATAVTEASAGAMSQLFPHAAERIGERVERLRGRLRARALRRQGLEEGPAEAAEPPADAAPAPAGV